MVGRRLAIGMVPGATKVNREAPSVLVWKYLQMCSVKNSTYETRCRKSSIFVTRNKFKRREER